MYMKIVFALKMIWRLAVLMKRFVCHCHAYRLGNYHRLPLIMHTDWGIQWSVAETVALK